MRTASALAIVALALLAAAGCGGVALDEPPTPPATTSTSTPPSPEQVVGRFALAICAYESRPDASWPLAVPPTETPAECFSSVVHALAARPDLSLPCLDEWSDALEAAGPEGVQTPPTCALTTEVR